MTQRQWIAWWFLFVTTWAWMGAAYAGHVPMYAAAPWLVGSIIVWSMGKDLGS